MLKDRKNTVNRPLALCSLSGTAVDIALLLLPLTLC